MAGSTAASISSVCLRRISNCCTGAAADSKVTAVPTPCGGAEFALETWVVNADENFTVQYSICDADGKEVAYGVRPADCTAVRLYVPDAVLWDCDHPYLYTVTAMVQRRNEAYDMVSARAG